MAAGVKYLKVTIDQDSPEDEFYVEGREVVRVTVLPDRFKVTKLRRLPPGKYRWEWRGFNEADVIWLTQAVKDEAASVVTLDFVSSLPDPHVSYAEKAFRARFPKPVPGMLNIFQAANSMMERVRITKRWKSYAVLEKNTYIYRLEEFIENNAPDDQWCYENGEIWVSRDFISQYIFLGERGSMAQIVRRDEVQPLS